MQGVPHRFSSRLARTVAAVACAAGAAACESQQSPLNVIEFQALQTSSSNGNALCQTSGQPESTGILDSARTPCCSYAIGVEMKNNLLITTDDNTPSLVTDTHQANIDTVSLSYQFTPQPGGSPISIPSAKFPVSAIIQSSSETSFISPLLANATALANQEGTLIVEVQFSGSLQDGTAITSGSQQFPIDICAGCAPLTCAAGESAAACTLQSVDQPDGTVCVTPM